VRLLEGRSRSGEGLKMPNDKDLNEIADLERLAALNAPSVTELMALHNVELTRLKDACDAKIANARTREDNAWIYIGLQREEAKAARRHINILYLALFAVGMFAGWLAVGR